MAYSYVFLPEAQEEYEEALYWYLDRSIKAAEGFVDAMNAALLLACQHPGRWRNEYADYYEISTRKYPFSIIYFKDDHRRQVLVVSVYHHSRNPLGKYRK